MAERADIVILGAGLAGAATAYHLRRRGAHGVVILEQEPAPGQHSTGRNAAMVREYTADTALQPLLSAGAAALRSGELAEFRRTGSVLLGLGNDDVSHFFPLAQGRGRHFPDDGVTDPAALLASYLRGQDVRCGVAVRGWSADSSGVQLDTTAGRYSAGLLVNAAGPWAGSIGALPLAPFNRHLYVTPPMPRIDPAWPFVWDLQNGLYFRPESGGLLLCPCDEGERSAGDYALEAAVQDRLADLLARTQPKLADIAIRRAWTGQRTFAPDRRFVIGRDPRHAQLFHVAGLGGHGVTASYAVGELAAMQILDTSSAASVSAFDPLRLIGPPSVKRE